MSASGRQFQADRWAGEMGEKWNRYLEEFESSIGPVGTAALEAAEFRPGERVLDIGCGGGLTTIAIAKLVGPKGSATGVDISPALIETCRRRAAALQNVSFVCGDAAKIDLPGAPFDRLFSRFGIMFFDDPRAAFRHIHGLVKPGGHALFACWGPLAENPWVTELMEVPRRYVELPAPEPNAPGPFALADPAYTTEILTQAGFADVSFQPWRGDQQLGGPRATAERAADFVMQALFIGDLLKEEPESVKRRAREDLRAILKRHEGAEGVALRAMAWFVSATAR